MYSHYRGDRCLCDTTQGHLTSTEAHCISIGRAGLYILSIVCNRILS